VWRGAVGGYEQNEEAAESRQILALQGASRMENDKTFSSNVT
jgi:hypothetical protein